jgi:hypothetical protein
MLTERSSFREAAVLINQPGQIMLRMAVSSIQLWVTLMAASMPFPL